MEQHWKVLAVVAAVALMMGMSTGCGGPAVKQPAEPPANREAARTAAAPVPFRLYTHCGIDEAHFRNRYYEAVPPLSDGKGNPPHGWGNPFQQGTVRVRSASELEFRDAAQHVVRFRLRERATGFKRICD